MLPLLFAAGCRNDKIQSYRVPKESPDQSAPANPHVVSTNIREIPKGESELPHWAPPAHWQEQSPSPMRVASFRAKNNGGESDISISKLSGTGGGTLANINRWRGQIGLEMLTESSLATVTKPLDPKTPNAILVDMTGTDSKTGRPTRLVAAIVPQIEETWFYKMTGDPAAVEGETEIFLKFVRSANYEHNH